VDTLLRFLHAAGFSSLTKDADYYGLGLTLGNGEVSLYELTRAYSIFAHDGKLCDITAVSTSIKTCPQIATPKAISGINLILTNRYFKLGGFPVHSSLDFEDRNVFVKTGTSRNFRDNWAVGYTDHYIIGVWTGNKS
jgi:penicillin-binding protein 1C